MKIAFTKKLGQIKVWEYALPFCSVPLVFMFIKH